MDVYIILVVDNDGAKVSQEGYTRWIDAVNFVTSRADKPQKIDTFNYASSERQYRIGAITVK